MAEVNMQHRDEFHRAIGVIADDLSDSVAMFGILRTYVLGTMYYRFVSELFTALVDKNEHDYDSRNADFSYAELSDDDAMSIYEDNIDDVTGRIANNFGFDLKLKPSELFCNVCKRADKEPDLNKTLEKIFWKIRLATGGRSTLFGELFADLYDDFYVNNRNRIGADGVTKRNERLVKLLYVIRDMKLGTVNNIDAFSDVYYRDFSYSQYLKRLLFPTSL